MGFLFLAIALGIIGNIFLHKVYRTGNEQFVRYNLDNSNLLFSTKEDFLARISAFTDIKTSIADSAPDVVKITYKTKDYTIKFTNGKAFVDYDTAGTGIKLTKLGRLLNIFSFVKSVKKAFLINSLLDRISNQSDSTEMPYKKFTGARKTTNILFLAMLVSLVIGICSFTSDVKDKAILNVKESICYENITYGEIVDVYLVDPNWIAFNSETDTPVVEVNGTSVENQEICIQFTGELGAGFHLVEKQTFKPAYFSVDGTSVDTISSLEYILAYLGK